MKTLLEKLQTALENQQDAVLVTIIADSGSCPRGAGANMLVLTGRDVTGTIGGGSVEYEAIEQSAEVLKGKTSYTQAYILDKNQIADIGMICGGNVTVYFQYIPAGHKDILECCHRAIDLINRNADVWLITDISDEDNWKTGLYSRPDGLFNLEIDDIEPLLKSKAAQVKINNRHYFTEPLNRAGMVYIFGGGHVAQELAPVLHHVGFRYTLFEDRQQFATRELFPDAEEIILGDYSDIGKNIQITENDYVVIMTRGHLHDYSLQVQILKTPAYYIGVIGSVRKFHALAERMKSEEGFTDEDIRRIHSPIGTAIRAETPAEIAISIAGQMILRRAEKIQGIN